MDTEQRDKVVREKCAADLYYAQDLFPGVKWVDVDREIRDSYRVMVAVVFKSLFEMSPTEVSLLFIDGRKL